MEIPVRDTQQPLIDWMNEIVRCNHLDDNIQNILRKVIKAAYDEGFDFGKKVAQYEKPDNPDNVNHPAHYTGGGVECIDAMVAAYGKEAVRAFCMCNAFKYQWRFGKKNGAEDIRKAQWYQNKFLELSEE